MTISNMHKLQQSILRRDVRILYEAHKAQKPRAVGLRQVQILYSAHEAQWRMKVAAASRSGFLHDVLNTVRFKLALH